MGAALFVFALLTFSVLVIRVASVALRHTGLTETSARFQALSAFTGTGFTTTEAETVVNYPVRRRVVALLMIVGNLGLVSVFATLVVSMVNTGGEPASILRQLLWLIGSLAVLWFVMLNPVADRVTCRLIGNLLRKTTFLGRRGFERVLQVSDGLSVAEHPVSKYMTATGSQTLREELEVLGLTVLAVRGCDGVTQPGLADSRPLDANDTLVVFGRDEGHEVLAKFRASPGEKAA